MRREGSGNPGNHDIRRVDELMDTALRGKLESTYQRDYLGLPLGIGIVIISNFLLENNRPI